MHVLKSLSIRYKMMIPILLILVVLGSVLVFVFQYKTLWLVNEQLRLKGETTLNALISSGREGVVNENLFGSLDRLVINSLHDREIESLVIMDKNMSVLASSINTKNWNPRNIISKDNLSIVDGPDDITFSSPIELDSGDKLEDMDNRIGYIYLVFSKKIMQQEIGGITKTMTQVIFVALFLTAVFVLMITNILIKPILTLTNSSKKIEKGHYDEEIPVSGHDEIGELSRAFEVMRQQINVKMIETTRAKEEAVQLAKFRETFLANMSHEIRTPMNGVIGIIELLTLNTKLDATQKEYVEIIKNSSHDLLAILNDILDLSKLEAGEMNIAPKIFNYKSLIHKVKSLFIGKADEKGLKITSEYGNDFPEYVLADSNRITQILSNFVSNAIKFTDTGSVNISSTWKQKELGKIIIRIEVIDTGVGIDEKGQKVAFEEFKQLDEGSTKAFKGTGLGLAICSKLTNLMGGEIGVDSEKGKGSTFWFTFESDEIEAGSFKDSQSNKSKEVMESFDANVLLVDDEKINIIVAKLMLEGMGCKVTTAENGLEAVNKYEDGKFDVILMDMQMPVMDGIEATNNIKESFNNVPPIIGLSANAMVGDAEKFIAQGLDDYLSKPTTIAALKEKLNLYCRS
ncbi:MAG: hypothetical protein COA49_03420 [Bacteroidetes bacterium]|nr:MAG: hypothetical protein COA49_03420 [Bacteroidota bacterium]